MAFEHLSQVCRLTLCFETNILIDYSERACLADFGLHTFASDPTNAVISSFSQIWGTVRWRSPELLDPDQFNAKDGRPTKESDAYALGMVILEVMSGNPPFKPFKDTVVTRMVLDEKQPERPYGPEGVRFGNGLWEMMQLCWKFDPENRARIKDVLEFLENISSTWTPSNARIL